MLEIKLTNSGLSADGTLISLQDTTGAYNSTTRPGGYGTPNPASGAAQLAFLRYNVYGAKPVYVPVVVSAMISGRTFSPLQLGITADASRPFLFPDGVNVFEYLVGYPQAGSVSAEGKVLDVTGITIPAGTKYISFDTSSSVVYEIAETLTNSLILTTEPILLGSDQLITYYSSPAYELVDTYIQRMIDRKVIALSGLCEGATELLEDVMNMTAAAARFAQTDYLGANELITTLNRRYEYASRRL